jgi:hypothetical protein
VCAFLLFDKRLIRHLIRGAPGASMNTNDDETQRTSLLQSQKGPSVPDVSCRNVCISCDCLANVAIPFQAATNIHHLLHHLHNYHLVSRRRTELLV